MLRMGGEIMDPVVIGAAVIIGIVDRVKVQFPQVKGIYAFVLALAIGIIGGYFAIIVGDVKTGVIATLVGTGVYKLANRIGSK